MLARRVPAGMASPRGGTAGAGRAGSLPMAATRTLLLKTGLVPSIGWVSLIVTAVAIAGALVIWWVTRGTRLDFLFRRPERFRIAPARRSGLQPAE